MRNINWWRFFGVIGALVFCTLAWVGIFAVVDGITGLTSPSPAGLPDGVAGVYTVEARDDAGGFVELPWMMKLEDGLFVMSMGDNGTKLGPEARWEYGPGDGIIVRITDAQGYHLDIRPIKATGQLAVIVYKPGGEITLALRATKLVERPKLKLKGPPPPSLPIAGVMP